VTAETPGEAKPAEEPKKAPVVFKSVDYQDVGAESGKVVLSGTGEPGARIFLYIDETPLGEVSVGSDGNWAFAADRKLETGEHKFRADGIEEATRNVISSASIGIVRMEPPKEEVAAAPAEPTPPPAPEAAPEAAAPEAATPQPEPEQEVAAAEEAKPAPEKRAQRKRHRPRVYTVRRGDTLWEIAEAYYGGGWHYRAIVRDNRRKIRNPHWIYPRQKFHIPAGR
jgi:nucleoid-associated protein YgaU